MLDILDFHGNNSPTEELDEVVILPYDETRLDTSGSFTIPDGEWDDFDYVIAELSIAGVWHGSAEVQKERIVSAAYGSPMFRVGYTANTKSYIQRIFKVTETTGSWELVTGSSICSVLQIVGYKKRYATKNLSKTVVLTPENTTGGTFVNGTDVQVNQRYEIDIASVLGSDYVGKDLIVREEIYNDGSSGGTLGWGKSPLRDVWEGTTLNSWYHYGIDGDVEDDKIVVYTAGYGANISTGHSLIPAALTNKWGVTSNVSSAPCRIKVWTVQQYVTNNTLDLIAALEARIAALENA